MSVSLYVASRDSFLSLSLKIICVARNVTRAILIHLPFLLFHFFFCKVFTLIRSLIIYFCKCIKVHHLLLFSGLRKRFVFKQKVSHTGIRFQVEMNELV